MKRTLVTFHLVSCDIQYGGTEFCENFVYISCIYMNIYTRNPKYIPAQTSVGLFTKVKALVMNVPL